MTGGGTGGHVNPAIAIANSIKENLPGSEIAFVGTSRGIENKLVPAAGYKLYHVEVQGFKRSLSLYNVKSAWLAFVSPIRAKKIIREFKPDIVIGTGGYVCWPILRAASLMGIPTAIHESNAIPGVAVKMLAKYVDRIYVNFEATAECLGEDFRKKIKRVGNPIKGDFTAYDRRAAREKLGIEGKYKYFILSCGGSMGAEKVNDEVLELMRRYTSKHPEILHVHATGAIEYEAATAKFREYQLEKFDNIQLLEYIYDMPIKMAAADIVINRAGAMTLSELALLGKCAVLIPSPHVTDNHQYKNAKALADRGAALLFEEKDLSGDVLTNAIDSLISDSAKRRSMENAIAEFAMPNANHEIFEDICRIAKKK